MRDRVHRHSTDLLTRGQRLLNWIEDSYARHVAGIAGHPPVPAEAAPPAYQPQLSRPVIPGLEFTQPGSGWESVDLFGVSRAPVPIVFKARLAEYRRGMDEAKASASPLAAANPASSCAGSRPASAS